jgi:hypothetical protein
MRLLYSLTVQYVPAPVLYVYVRYVVMDYGLHKATSKSKADNSEPRRSRPPPDNVPRLRLGINIYFALFLPARPPPRVPENHDIPP